jgi:hypothetical protein
MASSELLVLSIKDQCDRSVVVGFDVHLGTEDASGDGFFDLLGELFQKTVVELPALLRIGCTVERGARAFSEVAVEGELAYSKDCSTDVLQGAVHLAFAIIEDTDTGEFVYQPVDVGGFVIFPDPDKDEQAMADRAGDLVVHRDRGPTDPLDYDSHALLNENGRFLVEPAVWKIFLGSTNQDAVISSTSWRAFSARSVLK